MDVVLNKTSFLKDIFIQDSTKTDGSGLAGLTNSSGGLQMFYHRQADSAGTQVGSTGSLAALTVGTFTSGGFAAITGVRPGWYQIGIPNACFTALGPVTLSLGGATNMMDVAIELQVVAYDPNDAVSLGLSRIDAAITSRMATYTQPTGFLAATFPSGTIANTTNLTAGTIAAVSGAVGSVTGNIGGNLLGTLSTTERNAIADAYLDRADAIETSMTPRLAMRYQFSAIGGALSGAGGTTITFKGGGVSTTRMVWTVDGSGNRTSAVFS